MKTRLTLLVLMQLSLIGSALAQTPKATPIPPTPQMPAAGESRTSEPPHELTAADVHAFLDGFVPMQLERENIAGAVVLVVTRTAPFCLPRAMALVMSKSESPSPWTRPCFGPDRFPNCFIWTAVMQLVEQGESSIWIGDVNDYLDFKIPAKFGKPITLRNLMTHSAGFEEQIKDLITSEGAPMATLKQHLTEFVAERIFPPGTTPAYSNYGASLAGYIVERVSQRPFNDYISENIFKPLGMSHSSFFQPLPADLNPLMSNGYAVGSGKAKPFEIIEEAPAGALSATAADLARFMIAHLQNGKLASAQILRPEIVNLMHSRQLGLSPALNGMCLGFYEETRNGHRIIGHGGDTFYFHSDLHLVLDSGIGFFVSYNSAGKGELSPRTALWNHFLDRYLP